MAAGESDQDRRKDTPASIAVTSQMAAADLYCDVQADPEITWRDHVPGLLVVVAGTLAAAFLSDRHGAALTLMALLVGLSLNFLSSDRRLAPGLAFASRSLLRWGIVFLGARVTLGEMLALGPAALIAIVAIVAAVFSFTILVSRRLGHGAAFGALAGGSVAICGASAALALAAVLGERRISQAQLALVLVGVSAMSATAMVLYPLIAGGLGMSDLQAGFVMGASIHDVAQSIGAGYAFSPGAGRIAAIVKLARVALLAPVLIAVSAWLGRSDDRPRLAVPWFVAGFFLLALLNSVVALPPTVTSGAEHAAAALLAVAVTATGIQAPLSRLRSSGMRPVQVIGLATLVSLVLALLVATLLLH